MEYPDPEGKVHAQVRAGWVMLDGEVEHAYQRHEVERMARHVRGVVGIRNNILIVPQVSADQDRSSIEMSAHCVKFTDAAAAAAAPGVSAVKAI